MSVNRAWWQVSRVVGDGGVAEQSLCENRDQDRNKVWCPQTNRVFIARWVFLANLLVLQGRKNNFPCTLLSV